MPCSKIVVKVDKENEKLASLELIVKKRQQELDQKRKENLSIIFEKRSLESNLNSANRRIHQLNSDIQAIHNELNMFAGSFESKLEAAIQDKDEKLEMAVLSLEKADKEVKNLQAENNSISKRSLELMTQNDKLTKRLASSDELIRGMAHKLRGNIILIDDLCDKVRHEQRAKDKLNHYWQSAIESLKDKYSFEHQSEWENAMNQVLYQKENELNKVVKDNIHLTKEIESIRQELISEEMLFIPERINKQENQKKIPTQPKLFTQNTLMLDFPSFLDISAHGSGEGRLSIKSKQ